MMRMLNIIPRYDVAFRPKTRLLDSYFNNWVIPTTNLSFGYSGDRHGISCYNGNAGYRHEGTEYLFF